MHATSYREEERDEERAEEDAFPAFDRLPLAESSRHLDEMVSVLEVLEDRYRAALDVWVSGHVLLYTEAGNPDASVVADVLLVDGVRKRSRRSYRPWEEGRVPALVVEVTSRQTREEDLERKLPAYERLGVAEVVLHDPLEEHLSPPLQGFRLAAGRYRRLPNEPDGSLLSRATGLVFRREGHRLRLVDAASGAPLLRHDERMRRLRDASHLSEERFRAAEERARLAELELSRVREELERLRLHR